MQTLLDALGALASRWDFPTPRPWPHMFYSTSVTNELVPTLSKSQRTSSNSILPVAWVTRLATDLRPSDRFYALHCRISCNYHDECMCGSIRLGGTISVFMISELILCVTGSKLGKALFLLISPKFGCFKKSAAIWYHLTYDHNAEYVPNLWSILFHLL